MNFKRVVPGPPGSELTIIVCVSLRRIFFILDLSWESLRKQVISEKLSIFAKICFSKVRFFTLRCSLLELLSKLKHFLMKLHTLLQQAENISGYHKLKPLKRIKNIFNPWAFAKDTNPNAVGVWIINFFDWKWRIRRKKRKFGLKFIFK